MLAPAKKPHLGRQLYARSWRESKAAVAHNSNPSLPNLYYNGSEGIGWHSDDETTLGRHPEIASLSFGAERVFKRSTLSANEMAIEQSIMEERQRLVSNGKSEKHSTSDLLPSCI